MNRKPLLTILSCFIILSTSAQTKSLFGRTLKDDLQAVVADFTNKLQNLKGEVIEKNPQTIEYYSTVKPVGAVEAVVTEYSSSTNSSYSWSTTLLVTEEYEEAAKKYKSVFNQLKGAQITLSRDLHFSLRGDFEPPSETKRFFTSHLTLLPAAHPLQKMKIEVSMVYEFPEWRVNVMVFEKEKEDNERGAIADY